MWVGGCVTAPVGWVSGPSALASRGPWGPRCRGTRGPARPCGRPWGRRSVHRLAKMASRRRFGAFVYTVGPWAWVVGGLGIAIVYTNGRIGPLRAGLGHLCTLLRRCGQARGRRSVHRLAKMAPRRRFGPFVYTVATRAAMRVATRAAGRCRAWHRSAGVRRSAFQMNGKRLMGGSSRSCDPRRDVNQYGEHGGSLASGSIGSSEWQVSCTDVSHVRQPYQNRVNTASRQSKSPMRAPRPCSLSTLKTQGKPQA